MADQHVKAIYSVDGTDAVTALEKIRRAADRAENALSQLDTKLNGFERSKIKFNKAMESMTSSTDNFTTAIENADTALGKYNKKLEVFADYQKTLGASISSSSADIRDQASALSSLNTAMRDHGGAMATVKRGQESLTQGLSRLSDNLAENDASMSRISKASEAAKDAMEGAGGAARGMGRSLSRSKVDLNDTRGLLERMKEQVVELKHEMQHGAHVAEEFGEAFKNVARFSFFRAGAVAGLRFFQVMTAINVALPILSAGIGGIGLAINGLVSGLGVAAASLGRVVGILGTLPALISAYGAARLGGMGLIKGILQPALQGQQKLLDMEQKIQSQQKKVKNAKTPAERKTASDELALMQFNYEQMKRRTPAGNQGQELYKSVERTKTAWFEMWQANGRAQTAIANVIALLNSTQGFMNSMESGIQPLFNVMMRIVQDLTKAMSGGPFVEFFQKTLAKSAEHLGTIWQILKNIAPYLAGIMEASQSFTSNLLEGILGWSEKFNDKQFLEDKLVRLNAFFLRAETSIQTWTTALKNFGAGFANIFGAATGITSTFQTDLLSISEVFRDWTDKRQPQIQGFFASSYTIFRALGNLVVSIFTAFGELSGARGGAAIGSSGLPLAVEQTVTFIDMLGGGIITFANYARRALEKLGEPLNEFWNALGGALGSLSGPGFAAAAAALKSITVGLKLFEKIGGSDAGQAVLAITAISRVLFFVVGLFAGTFITPFVRFIGKLFLFKKVLETLTALKFFKTLAAGKLGEAFEKFDDAKSEAGIGVQKVKIVDNSHLNPAKPLPVFIVDLDRRRKTKTPGGSTSTAGGLVTAAAGATSSTSKKPSRMPGWSSGRKLAGGALAAGGAYVAIDKFGSWVKEFTDFSDSSNKELEKLNVESNKEFERITKLHTEELDKVLGSYFGDKSNLEVAGVNRKLFTGERQIAAAERMDVQGARARGSSLAAEEARKNIKKPKVAARVGPDLGPSERVFTQGDTRSGGPNPYFDEKFGYGDAMATLSGLGISEIKMPDGTVIKRKGAGVEVIVPKGASPKGKNYTTAAVNQYQKSLDIAFQRSGNAGAQETSDLEWIGGLGALAKIFGKRAIRKLLDRLSKPSRANPTPKVEDSPVFGLRPEPAKVPNNVIPISAARSGMGRRGSRSGFGSSPTMWGAASIAGLGGVSLMMPGNAAASTNQLSYDNSSRLVAMYQQSMNDAAGPMAESARANSEAVTRAAAQGGKQGFISELQNALSSAWNSVRNFFGGGDKKDKKDKKDDNGWWPFYGGGQVPGRLGMGRDSVPARLHPGEVVLNRSQQQIAGKGNIARAFNSTSPSMASGRSGKTLAMASGGAVWPTNPRGTIGGSPYQGTHTLGNWQSDNALDIMVPTGTNVLAVVDGTVTRTGGSNYNPNDRFNGFQAYVSGAGNEWFYTHLSKLVASAGSKVAAGQIIGLSGAANGVDHLHIGQRSGDPRNTLGGVVEAIGAAAEKSGDPVLKNVVKGIIGTGARNGTGVSYELSTALRKSGGINGPQKNKKRREEVEAARQAVNLAAYGISGGPIPAGAAAGAQSYARSLMASYGWGEDQWAYLLDLWTRESGWNSTAVNKSSGATGIPQLLPGAHTIPKNWDDPRVQIKWGMDYIAGRYRTPQAAINWHDANNWYGTGGSFLTNGPTMVGVGERGKERVDVTPLAGAGSNVNRGAGGGTININSSISVGTLVGDEQGLKQLANLVGTQIAKDLKSAQGQGTNPVSI